MVKREHEGTPGVVDNAKRRRTSARAEDPEFPRADSGAKVERGRKGGVDAEIEKLRSGDESIDDSSNQGATGKLGADPEEAGSGAESEGRIDGSDDTDENSDSASDSDSPSDSASDSDSASVSGSESDSGSDSESVSGSESGSDQLEAITEEEQFRHLDRYRKLDEQLERQRAQVALDGGVKLVADALKKAEGLFETTKKTGQANMVAKDSSTFREISTQARIATQNMNVGQSGKALDFDQFASMFNKKWGTPAEQNEVETLRDELPSINWLSIGLRSRQYSSRAATCQFLLGPLELSKKQRATRQRITDDSRAAVAQTAGSRNANEVQESSEMTARMSQKLYKKLNEAGRMRFVDFYVHPTSYRKSVETLFYAAFLANNEKLIMTRDDDGVLWVAVATPENVKDHPRYKARDRSKSHVIFKLGYADWEHLVSEYGIKEPFLDDDEHEAGPENEVEILEMES